MSSSSHKKEEEEEPCLEEIITEIVKTTQMDEHDKIKYFVSKYPITSDKNPILIKKACGENFDMDRFLWMLKMSESVGEKKISQHDASVKVGEMLVDQHIKPLLE
jgi:hypothetical protein